ncbi:MAG: transcription elongation factor GreA [Candidatus Cloacimonadota bacterium]|nr:MAG: transcription elongation factor GreA [Candidatus Cloacimonadota bacterium]PIE78269.1 MAG: transcription elongation factor GreA [Candidatus Delongbacteria bacterium]
MNYITKEGMEDLVNQLKDLKFNIRAEATERLNAARKHGDLRENGDYKAAKEEIAQIDAKIGELERTISSSQIIDKKDINIESVQILNHVKLKDHTRNRTLEYTLVSPSEADPLNGKLSVETPIAKGILGLKVGEKAIVKIPAGDIELEVLEISI